MRVWVRVQFGSVGVVVVRAKEISDLGSCMRGFVSLSLPHTAQSWALASQLGHQGTLAVSSGGLR